MKEERRIKKNLEEHFRTKKNVLTDNYPSKLDKNLSKINKKSLRTKQKKQKDSTRNMENFSFLRFFSKKQNYSKIQ